MVIGATGQSAWPDCLVRRRGGRSGHGLFTGSETKELAHWGGMEVVGVLSVSVSSTSMGQDSMITSP